MVLTKRPERALKFFQWRSRELGHNHILPNLQMGVTAENQEAANKRVPVLLQIPAAVRFVSVEPMLEWMSLVNYLPAYDFRPMYDYYRAMFPGMEKKPIKLREGIDWVICGCESGPGRRPFEMSWAEDLKDQCEDVHTPFFFKQAPVDGKIVEMPELDGKVWAQLPENKNQ